MNLINAIFTGPHEIACEYCEQHINQTELQLLRERCALPEEACVHVHETCVDLFLGVHPGHWRIIAKDSFEAGWFFS